MKWRGKPTTGVNRVFLGKVAAAAKAQGATYIYVISGKRTPETNTGVSNSNHLYGHALDGYAYIPGRGKVPLGTLVKDSYGTYGLRSGDQPGFYKGAPDPNHVDDGYNTGHQQAPSAPQEQTTTPPSAVDPVDTTGQPVGTGDPSLASAIGQIPQVGMPATSDPSLAGSFNDGTSPTATPADTWQLIAGQGEVSPETLRLAQLAGYGGSAASSG